MSPLVEEVRETMRTFRKERSRDGLCKWCLHADRVEGGRESDGGQPGEDGEWSTVEGTGLDTKRGARRGGRWQAEVRADLRGAQR